MLSILLPLCGLGLVACAPADDVNAPPPAVDSPDDIALPEPATTGDVSLEETLAMRRSLRSFGADPLTLDELAQLAWAAQGVSDESRGLRTAPSAGATYPLELYIAVGDVTDLSPGVYRYDPDAHVLSPVRAEDVRADLARAALSQRFIAEAPASVVISAVYARTEQRYGQRAERYVHMEAGHAAQNLALQAASLGLGTVPVGAFDGEEVAQVLGLPQNEDVLYILPVGRP